MPLLNSVTTPYAEALLQVVNENDQTEEIVLEVKQLLDLINDAPELDKALSSPVLETDAKKKIIIEGHNLWTVLSSYNLLHVVNLSGRRHLGFLVSTKNIARNGFYVSRRYF